MKVVLISWADRSSVLWEELLCCGICEACDVRMVMISNTGREGFGVLYTLRAYRILLVDKWQECSRARVLMHDVYKSMSKR